MATEVVLIRQAWKQVRRSYRSYKCYYTILVLQINRAEEDRIGTGSFEFYRFYRWEAIVNPETGQYELDFPQTSFCHTLFYGRSGTDRLNLAIEIALRAETAADTDLLLRVIPSGSSSGQTQAAWDRLV